MKFKKILSAALAAVMLTGISASASVLGSESVLSSRLDIGKGAVLESNVFFSDQSGVGYQSEYFVRYTPNKSLVPVIVNDSIYGRISTSAMANNLMSAGVYPSLLMNSDFFALGTGIPLSHQVTEGALTVMDTSDMDAIGINEDGSAFISWLSLNASFSKDGTSYDIDVFNKLRQPYGIYMYDSSFADTTKAETEGINIVLSPTSDKLRIGETIRAEVESVTIDEGAVPIPEGRLVLSADSNCSEEILNKINHLTVGDSVTLTVTADGDLRWKDASYILGAWGGRIITDSQITEADDSASPRTAFGITSDGALIFYTLDGRKSGHSYGARLRTLAKRMLELGCVDAVNLDGGGSTTLGAIYPGSSQMSIVNSPSDGAERKVATFMGLINKEAPTKKASRLFVYPYEGNYLSGTRVRVSAYATDDNYYRTDLPEEVIYTAPDGTSSADGEIILTGNGKVSATSGSLNTEVTLNCYDTPTDITVSDGKSKISSLSLAPGKTIALSASAVVGSKKLISDAGCFTWECTEQIGTIDEDGHFAASKKEGKGSITVAAGDFVKTIPVEIKADKPYPQITFEKGTGGEIIIALKSDSFPISDENILVKADGKEVNVQLKNNKINLVFSDNKTHRISVSVMNSGGYKAFGGYTVEGEQYESSFEDVDSTSWAKNYISYFNAQKIVNGSVENGRLLFRPDSEITRGEFAVMTANALSVNPGDFADKELGLEDETSIPPWCINHIKALSSLGIMTGKEHNGSLIFDAGAPLTRAEASTVISRLIPDSIEKGQMKFSDASNIPSWAEGAFSKLTSTGIINGYPDNTIRPSARIKRAEAVKLLYEIY